jgi:uncharacterized SAM-binding protein YcdF (DUF218 family)
MFFVLSKLLLIFIFPFTWVVVFLIAAIAIKKQNLKRRYLIIASIILLVFSNPFLMNRFARMWDIQQVALKPNGTYSCAIVLGGFSGEDANGQGFFNGAADRFIQALKLLSTGKVSHLVISGGNGNLLHSNFRESTWVKAQLKLFKVPDSCILIENKSRNTIENAAYSKTLLANSHLQPPYLLVTSAYHMRRSLGIFKKANIAIIPYPCNYIAGNGKFSADEFIPDVDVLPKWNLYIKEVIGSLVNYIK